MNEPTAIPGYSYGTSAVPRSPVTLVDFDLMKKSVLFGDETEIVPFRDLFLLVFPVTFTLKPFLAKKGHPAEDVEKMYLAWVKSCLLQMTLWTHPYVKDGDF